MKKSKEILSLINEEEEAQVNFDELENELVTVSDRLSFQIGSFVYNKALQDDELGDQIEELYNGDFPSEDRFADDFYSNGATFAVKPSKGEVVLSFVQNSSEDDAPTGDRSDSVVFDAEELSGLSVKEIVKLAFERVKDRIFIE